jgi:hypothetical protein
MLGLTRAMADAKTYASLFYFIFFPLTTICQKKQNLRPKEKVKEIDNVRGFGSRKGGAWISHAKTTQSRT